MAATRPHARISNSRVLALRAGTRAACLAALGIATVSLVAAPASATTPTQTRPAGGAPFASGKLASRSGSTLDIQGFNGDTKVIVTDSTKYRQTETTDGSAVKKGACVRVAGTGSTSKGIAATTVTVMDASSDCTRAGGRFGGPQGGNFNGRRDGTGTGATPSFPGGTPPSSLPQGANGDGQGLPTDFATITGKVTKVSGETVKVKGPVFQRATNGNARPNSSSNAKPKTKTVSVTLSSSTSVTHTVAATEAALAIGSCVNAAGNTDSVGTVTAQTVTITPAEDGECTPGGFGGGFGGGFRAGRGTPPDGGAGASTTPGSGSNTTT